uniref:endonuclease/exonuclease/phosphatase family protein n=1 Tax=Neoroseomonas terrae TaxID=424799 RepID=UPI0030BA28FA
MAWLRRAKPDVVCLPELKADQRSFPQATLRSEGYEAVWVGQSSWNGVAILARGREPVLTRTALPGDPSDHQARYVEAAVNGVLIATLPAQRQSAAGAKVRLQAGVVQAPVCACRHAPCRWLPGRRRW